MSQPPKTKVRERYNSLGGGLYDLRYRDEQERKYDSAILLTLPKNYELILDAGCGTGMMMEKIDASVVGVDISYSLIQFANKRKKNNQHVILSDVENLPIKNNIFSVCYAMTILQNIPDKIKTLKELRRVSKDGCRIIITALKAAFSESEFKDILDKLNFTMFELVGDSGTNDWIAYAET